MTNTVQYLQDLLRKEQTTPTRMNRAPKDTLSHVLVASRVGEPHSSRDFGKNSPVANNLSDAGIDENLRPPIADKDEL